MIHQHCDNTNPVLYSIFHTYSSNKRKILFKIANMNNKLIFNQYKNSIVKIKIILKLNQIIGGQANDQLRIGNYFLVNSINLCWS